MSRSLKRMGIVGLVCIAASLAPALADGNVNFVLGSRSMSDDDNWGDLDTQDAFGVNVDFGVADWPVRLVVGAHGSSKDKHDVEGSVGEASFGVMKLWKLSHDGMVRPYVGGGLAAVGAEIDGPGFDDDDGSIGLYISGGVYWRLGSRFNIGVDGRFLTGTDIELFGISGDADYLQIGLLLGFGWPKNN